jgi:hypothetical protein
MASSAATYVAGARPISYLESGKQLFVPLFAVTLEDGKAKVSSEALAAADLSVGDGRFEG